MLNKPNSKPKALLNLENIRGLNREHVPIRKAQLHDDPIADSCIWLEQALNLDLINPTAAVLSTANLNSKPDARIILLKEITELGYVFYTNYDSAKGSDLNENPQAQLTFYWDQLSRQLRIAGKVEKVAAIKSDDYFNSRPIGSQISAVISQQSKLINNREELEQKVIDYKKQHGDSPIARPQNWGGYILIPDYIEFWQGQEDRLHDRICFDKILAEDKAGKPIIQWNKYRKEP